MFHAVEATPLLRSSEFHTSPSFALPCASFRVRVTRVEGAKLQRRNEELQWKAAGVHELSPIHEFTLHAPRCTTSTVTMTCTDMFALAA